MSKDPRVDAYIAKSQPFARPILTHLRRVVHKAVPGVVENWKWSFPHFDYKGIFCGMAGFKAHCTFGFWKHSILVKQGVLPDREREAMGSFGCLRSIDDLPSDAALIKIIKAAAKLNDDGVKVVRAKKPPKPPVKTPADLASALKTNAKAQGVWDAFSLSKRRDYVEWLTEAKTAETRAKRLETAISWIAQGKGRNWKYERP